MVWHLIYRAVDQWQATQYCVPYHRWIAFDNERNHMWYIAHPYLSWISLDRFSRIISWFSACTRLNDSCPVDQMTSWPNHTLNGLFHNHINACYTVSLDRMGSFFWNAVSQSDKTTHLLLNICICKGSKVGVLSVIIAFMLKECCPIC